MKKKLKSLDEHNTTARAWNASLYGNTPVPNGIACPKCGSELLDSMPMVTLSSHPAQKNVYCPTCEYVGYRIA